MRDKRKIIALVLFIIMGFFMFTFANPSDNIDSQTTPVKGDEKTPVVEEPATTTPEGTNDAVIVVDNAPVINVNPKEVTIFEKDIYDVFGGVTVTDDKDTNLKAVADLTNADVLKLLAGKYTITYTVTDSAAHTATATRTLRVLNPNADEDGDGYTNKEEHDHETNLDNKDEHPEYDKSPSIAIDENNVFSMEINTTIPTFTATATDVADGDIKVVVTHDIDATKTDTYAVTFTAEDVLGNKTEVTKDFKVVDTTTPVFLNANAKHSTIDVVINATDNSGKVSIIEVTNYDTGKTFNINNGESLTEEATYSLYAYDASGNKSSQLWLAIDKTLPTINVEDGKIYNTDVNLVVFDKFLSKGSITINGTNYTSAVTNANNNENGTYHTTLATDGTYKIVATDKVGNTITKNITIDKTRPVITGLVNGGKYQDSVTFGTSEAIKEYIVDGTSYTESTVSKTIDSEGTHTVKVFDLAGNVSDEITFTVYKLYTVVFKDYDNKVLSTQSIKTNGSYIAPDMTGKTYTSKNVTYSFSAWDKNISNVISDLTIKANYDVTSAVANLYVLDKNVTRPTNGGGSSGTNYKKLGTISINITDDVKNTIKTGSNKILTYDLSKVLTYVSDQTLLPVPTNAIENFTKYEFYVLKFESADGFHIDCQEVVDTTALANYRSAAISAINTYAASFGFDINSAEITGIVNASGINGLNTKSSIDAAVVSAKSAIDSLFAGIKVSAKNEIQTTITNQALKNNYLTQANAIRDTANGNIDNALTIAAISSIKNTAIIDINNLKALSLITFNATITTVPYDWNYKYLVINDIASDVVITKVQFGYNYIDWFKIKIRFEDKYLSSSNNYNSSLLVNNRLEDSVQVIIEYTKNGIQYSNQYTVNRDYYVVVPYIVGITQTSSNYSA